MANHTMKDLANALDALRQTFADMQTNPRLKFDAEKEWVLQACEKNEYAIKAALANISAVEAALLNVAAVGITLDPARKLAYILPREANRMVYDLSYLGLINVAVTSGAIKWAQARRVYANDTFELTGFDGPPIHKCKPFAKPDERGEVIGVYVVAKMPDGDYLTNTMTIEEVNAIRDRSPSWKQGQKGPWKTDVGEMQKKTVVKNTAKWWQSDAVDRAVHYLNTEGGQGIDLTPEDEAKTRLAIWLDKVKATAKIDELRALLVAARKEFEEAQDPDGYAKVREAAIAHEKEINKPADTAPGARGARGAQTLSPAGKILQAIDRAKTFEELEATGPLIDALPADEQTELNDAYNQRLELRKQHGGTLKE